MATRAENEHAQAQRKGVNPKRAKKLSQRSQRKTKAEEAKKSTRRAKAAAYAKETPAKGTKASRESTRTSANRAKPDANLVLRAEREARSPKARAGRAKTERQHVRGS